MRVVIVWNGLPAYAASCLAKAKHCRRDDQIDLWGICPSPAQSTVDGLLDGWASWIPAGEMIPAKVFREPLDVMIVSGWHQSACLDAARAAKKQGAYIVAMIDNRWIGSVRQVARAVYNRLFRTGLYDAAWVPGRAGARMARSLGFPAGSIFRGLYGADPAIFTGGSQLASRPKRFLYVGQLIQRKNVVMLAEAFARFARSHPDWELVIYGDGPDRELIAGSDRIVLRPFASPEGIAQAMRESRFLVLPSREEHWGVVVHEACLSGCGLVLSSAVGAAQDLASPANCLTISNLNNNGIVAALKQAAEFTSQQLQSAEQESLSRSQGFGPSTFADNLDRIINQAEGRRLK
ncbi:MAG: glycosyltransferase [Planctomycetota bacterium]